VVGHQVDDHADHERVRLTHERVDVGQRPEQRVDVAVVGHVVARVALRRDVEGAQPNGVHTERRQVGQTRDDAGEVTDAVAVRVGERTRVDLVDNGAAPPLTAGAAGGGGPGRGETG
jgi:hypothetical protein